MKKNLTQILLVAELLAALLVIGAVSFWAPVCSGLLTLQNGTMVHMKCFYTAQAARILAIVLIAMVLATFYSRTDRNQIQAVIAVIALMLIAVTYESSMGIGICRTPMACHTTALWLRGSGILAFVAALVNISAGFSTVRETRIADNHIQLGKQIYQHSDY